jgi:hypothetical protein
MLPERGAPVERPPVRIVGARVFKQSTIERLLKHKSERIVERVLFENPPGVGVAYLSRLGLHGLSSAVANAALWVPNIRRDHVGALAVSGQARLVGAYRTTPTAVSEGPRDQSGGCGGAGAACLFGPNSSASGVAQLLAIQCRSRYWS